MNDQPANQNVNIFEQINLICKDFRRAYKAGQRPRIEDWLNRLQGDAQTTLFSNLLQSELRLRAEQGDLPESREYIKRFPTFVNVVRQAFDESTMGSLELESGTPGDSAGENATRTFEIPAANRLGDYELIGELGRGGFGVVYKARHLTRNNVVALKTLPTGVDGQELNADRLHKFRREFRSLSEINHPNLVGMQTLEVDGDQWFFTMDLIEGEDFLSFVRPNDRLDESRLRDAIKQLAKGIIALHERRIIHRDLKPSNVLVEPDGKVKILDFGLVAELQTATDQTASLKSAHFAGTPRYAAPEQMFGQRSEASDWYAFGVMLHEGLTGNPPFTGKVMELLRQKQNGDPPTLSNHTAIPNDLAELTDGLLKRDSKMRPDANDIIEALKLDQETRSHGSHRSSGSVDESELDQLGAFDGDVLLIGRETQLEQLELARQELLKNREPIVVFISGLSGEGKSSLAEKFLTPIRKQPEMLVLSGRCYDRESVPFKAIDCIIESLVVFLRSGKCKGTKLPEDIHFLAQLFPLLRRVESIDRMTTNIARMEPEKIRARAFYAMRELIVNVSTETPIVVLIDDLQWGDADSARVFVDLVKSSQAPALLLLGSYRSDEADTSPFLKTWNQLTAQTKRHVAARQVKVEPLSLQQCIELAAVRTGADQELIRQRADQLFEETGGNPYFIEQLMEDFDPSTGSFQHVPLGEIIAGRLTKLPVAASGLLDIIATSGQPISVDEASWAAGHTAAELGTLTHMRSEKLVRLVESGDLIMVDTYHDKVRETIVNGMSDEHRRGVHLKLAETIEKHEGLLAEELLDSLSHTSTAGKYETDLSPRIVDLAHHFAEAQDSRSFVYQVIAGEQALQAYTFEDAIGLYDQAEALIPADASPTLQFRLWFAIGRISLLKKDIDRAIDMHQKAVEVATNTSDRAEAYAGLSTVYRQVARFDQSNKCFDQALAQLGMRRPRRLIGKLFSFPTNSFRVLAVPASWQQSKSEQAKSIASLKYAIFEPMLGPVAEKDFFSILNDRAQTSLAAFQTGEPRMIGLGHAVAARLWSGIGIRWIGNLCLRRSGRIPTEAGDIDYRGKLLYSIAEASYWGGDLQFAKKTYEEAIPLLRRCGNFYDLLASQHLLRHIHAYSSSSSSELSTAQEVLDLASEFGNVQGICWGNYDVASALARRGDLAEAKKFIEHSNETLANERYFLTEAIRASTNGYVRLQCSDFQGARKLASAAWQIATQSFALADPTLFCLPVLIESIAGPNWKSPLPDCDCKYLKKMLRRAAFFYPMMPNHQPHLLRVGGRAAMALGKKRKAIRKFAKAIKLATIKGMDYQRAKSLLDLVAVKEEGRDESRREAIELLKKMESVIPRAESWLLGDQYDEAVVAPEIDLEAWEQENVKLGSKVKEEL